MSEALARLVRPLRDRIMMSIGRAVLAAVNDDTALQTLQIELLAEEAQDGVEHMQPYGLAYHPHPGGEGLAFAVGGQRSHAVILSVCDRRYRLKSLRPGEVALYDDLGSKILLGRDGIVIESAGTMSIETAGDFSISSGGTVSIEAGGDLLLDGSSIAVGAGASLDAARKTDTVSGSAITGGSSKVKIA